MEKTKGEKLRSSILKFGRRNILCRILAFPALFVCTFAIHLAGYIGGNAKRLSMVCVSLVFFAVYSSFSFPMFISNAGVNVGGIDIDADSEGISLAEENIFVLDGSGDNRFDEDGTDDIEQTAHDGMENEDSITADELIRAMEQDGEGVESEGEYSYNTSGGERADEDYSDYEFSKDDWRLILVNKQHSIPDDYKFTLGTIQGDMRCDERVIDDLLAMLKAAKRDGINLEIRSPYRTDERQTENFNKRLNYYMLRGYSYVEAYQLTSRAITVPGTSEHQIGLAFDITQNGYLSLNEAFADTKGGKWLSENSYKYGFVLRYPRDKEYITGIEFEPWHYRYVGVEAATYMTLNDMCLEEFWLEKF